VFSLPQPSILRFVEDNWLDGQRITGSFDALAGRLNSFFDFRNPDTTPYILDDSTGLVTR
jgi:phospholipase C